MTHWKIVRRDRSSGTETVIGFADTDAGAADARPRDDARYTYDVIKPNGSRVVTHETVVPHELVEIERKLTGFKIRGRLVEWSPTTGITVQLIGIPAGERFVPTNDIWQVISLEPR